MRIKAYYAVLIQADRVVVPMQARSVEPRDNFGQRSSAASGAEVVGSNWVRSFSPKRGVLPSVPFEASRNSTRCLRSGPQAFSKVRPLPYRGRSRREIVTKIKGRAEVFRAEDLGLLRVRLALPAHPTGLYSELAAQAQASWLKGEAASTRHQSSYRICDQLP